MTELGGTVKQTPSISGGNIITVSLGSRTFRLRPQVHVANSKPDFVLSSEGLQDVAIFTDGWQFHASPKCNNIADDADKRRILRQGGTLVLAITAQDLALDEAGDAATAPSCLSSTKASIDHPGREQMRWSSEFLVVNRGTKSQGWSVPTGGGAWTSWVLMAPQRSPKSQLSRPPGSRHS